MYSFDVYLHPFLTGPASFQMEYDEQMMMLGGKGLHLRFYRFSPPAVTIGYLQKDFPGADAALEIARRPTGGRAVFHHDEITYAACCAMELFEQGCTVMEFYDLIARALADGLQGMGIKADISRTKSPGRYTSRISCYSSVSMAEIVVDRKKLIGSAQCRKNNHILQHGSIPLTLDLELEGRLFGEGVTELSERIALYDLLDPSEYGVERIVSELTGGFARTLCGKVHPWEAIIEINR